MAITITDKALQEFTDYYKDDNNKYIRLYKTTIIFDEDFEIRGNDTGTVMPILPFAPSLSENLPGFHIIDGDNKFTTIDFYHYTSDSRTGRSVSIIGQTSESDNKQQIGSLDLYLTWSDDDQSFIGNSTINFDENMNRLTIDVTP